MESILFTPIEPGDHITSPEARIASLAAHLCAHVQFAGQLLNRGGTMEQAASYFFASLTTHVMNVYPENDDCLDEIYDFAVKHGLKGEVIAEVLT